MEDESLGKTPEERKKLIRSGGLTIRTTIDLRYQAAADKSVRAHVFPTDQALGGLAMVEPGTGNVRAIAQSRPMGRNKPKGETYLNYVVPTRYGDSAGFQAGSTFKAFVLAAALAKGIDPRTTLSVPSQEFIPMNDYRTCDGPYTSTEIWDPQNYDGRGGTFDLYSGTQLSVNTFFANLELLTGLCQPYELAKSMGIDLTNPDRERVPSFTLGVVNTSPLEMAEAYATFAAQGKHCASRAVTAIEDAAGQPAQGVPLPVHPGAGGERRQHRQRHPQGRHGARRVRLRDHDGPAGRRQDRHHPGRQVRVVRRLHPEPRHGRDDRRRQRGGPADPAGGPDRRRLVHRQRLRLRHRRPDVG